MRIKIFRDLKQYTLTSTLKKEDIELVKKYQPEALKEKDAEGNDVFAVSYTEGKPCVYAKGVTFGGTTHEGGYAMIKGELPETLAGGETYGDYIADKVGSALAHINHFEETIPAVVEAIKTERAELIESIVEA